MSDLFRGFFDGNLILLDLHASNSTLLTILLCLAIAIALLWIFRRLR